VANWLFDPDEAARLPWRDRVAYFVSLALLTPVMLAIGGLDFSGHALPIAVLSICAGVTGMATTELKLSHDQPFLWRGLEKRRTRLAIRVLLLAVVAGLSIALGSPVPLALVPVGVVLLSGSQPR
jgi:hypothetical protein